LPAAPGNLAEIEGRRPLIAEKKKPGGAERINWQSGSAPDTFSRKCDTSKYLMSTFNWERVESLFLRVADLPEEQRADYLDTVCAGDMALRQEVLSLLAADTMTGAGIASLVEGTASSLFDKEDLSGERIGPWKVERELGRGGMGAVYLATRADGQYEKEVAIKLIRRGMDTDHVLGRFRHERQILAHLEHPWIARLLDGGSTAEGRPYFVMEYVAGQPLDVWCREAKPTVRERCELFLKICAAVSLAHRNLIVHRDLKPGNVLVTADGTPKLLDFGVAKLLDPGAAPGEETVAALRPMTPNYASPEQVRGEPITTATDVYSLGAIFYEMLTGVRAHRFTSFSPTEVHRVVCEVDPPRLTEAAPQEARTELAGDLEAIAAMALRKERDRRYQSVDQLAGDVRCYLEGRPVMAHHGSAAYRAGKYLRRHRTPIGIAAILAFALVGGAGAAGWEAVRAARAQVAAELERQVAVASQLRAEASQRDAETQATEAQKQRANAEAERLRAEAQRSVADLERRKADGRFEQVRQLAGKFLLDFHNAIATLPGSTPARKMVVETGLQFYGTLIKEAAGNKDLLEEIARGYDRLGDVQGNPYFANLGDVPGAIASYKRAEAIRGGVVDESPAFLAERIRGRVKMAQVLVAQGDMKGGDALYREAFTLAEKSPAAGSIPAREALENAYSAYGDLMIRIGQHGDAVEPFRKQLELAEQLAREKKTDAATDRDISLAHTKLGDIFGRIDRETEALPHLRTALEIDRRVSEAQPNNLPLLRKLFVDYNMIGRIFRSRAGPALDKGGEAKFYLDGAVSLAEKMVAADPDNRLALSDAAMAEDSYGDWLHDSTSPASAVPYYQKARTNVERMVSISSPGGNEDFLIQVYQRLAHGLIGVGQPDEALSWLAKAEGYLVQAEKQNPGLSRNANRQTDIQRDKAEAYANLKRWPEAIQSLTDSLKLFDGLRQRDPANVFFLSIQPDLYTRLAEAYASSGRQDAAVTALRTGLDRLHELEGKRPLVKEEEDARQHGMSMLSQLERR